MKEGRNDESKEEGKERIQQDEEGKGRCYGKGKALERS